MEKKLKENQRTKIGETMKDFKCLLSRYMELKNDDEKLKLFFTRNRNPIWDITNTKFFKTGLKSERSQNLLNKDLVDDHFIQRSKSLKFIFSEMEKNIDMDLDTFIILVKKLCSTVKLTKDEHSIVTQFAKKNPTYLNYETYLACNIKIDGLSDFILK
jgi:hypothetical protein